MLWSPAQAELSLIATSVADGTRPTSTRGTAVTATGHADGIAASLAASPWVTILTSGSVTEEILRLDVHINTVGTSTSARHGVVVVGIDPAGGTDFADYCHLFAGQAGSAGIGGHFWSLLCRIPAGSTVGVRPGVSTSVGSTFRVSMEAYGRPSPSHLFRPAKRIQSIGINNTDAAGVAVVPGTTSEGAWALIGQLDFDAFAWEHSPGTAGSALNANRYDVDLGWCDVSSPAAPEDVRKIIESSPVITTAAEQSLKHGALTYKRVPASSYIFGRAQMGPNALPSGSFFMSAIAMGA